MRTNFLDSEFEIKSVEDTGAFTGYASTFGNIDEQGDRIVAGAFETTLKKRHPMLFWQHNPGDPIGTWTHLQEDRRGLFVEGQLLLDAENGRRAHGLMKMKPPGLTGLSIGFGIPDGGAERQRNGVRRITEIDLWEISLVSFPANVRARVNAVKSLLEDSNLLPSKSDFEALLREMGLSCKEAKLVTSIGYDGLRMTRDEDMDAIFEGLKARDESSDTPFANLQRMMSETRGLRQ